MKSLDEFLQGLPILSIGQKHVATIECDLSQDLDSAELVWIRLNRTSDNSTTSQAGDDIKLISLNKKIITPDKRFKVRRQSSFKWLLSIENVAPDDGHAYYLCQAGASRSGKVNRQPEEGLASRLVGGAKLNVLVPPRIVEQDTSGSLAQVDEFETFSLRCKVASEPQSQLMWKREDGKSIEELEQRFRHHIERKAGQILSVDSSELIFSPILRHQAGAYLCIAANGVQPGVSKRMSVGVVNCRSSEARSAPSESCESVAALGSDGSDQKQPQRQPQQPARNSWRTGGAGSSKPSLDKQRRQQQHHHQQHHQQLSHQSEQKLPADKRRTQTNGASPTTNDLGQVSIKHPNNSTDSQWAQSSCSRAIWPAGWQLTVLLLLCQANIITTLVVHYGRIVIL